MKSVILGTAGHIDHGKTELVKALTGVNTDRLEEERRRGISIELGFASYEDGDVRFGIVDVPGHERFVKNMLAGAGGIDLVLLVVAADEGVMPQTREHLDIVNFLGVERGLVALTKCDLADEEMIEIAHLDAEEVLQGTTLAGSPIVHVSAVTGEGLDELKAALKRIADATPARTSEGAYRLPIDRVFTMKGFGTVVTGTSFAGSVAVGEKLEIQPGERTVRVRRIQVHGRDSENAQAGQRTALALHGVTKDEISRGEQLVSPGSLTPSSMVDVRLRVSSRWVRPLRNRERVRFHLGSSEDLGRVVLLDRDELAPGEDCLAQIRLETPIVPALHDRFVLRSYSPMHTMAGGMIVDPHPKKHHRFRADELEALKGREGGGPIALLLETVSQAGLAGVTVKALVKSTSLPREEVDALVAQEIEGGTLRLAEGGRILDRDTWSVARRTILEEARRFQQKHPLRWGMTREEARLTLGRETTPAILGELLAELAAEGEVRLAEDRLRVGEGDVVFDGKAKAERERLDAVFRGPGCSPPYVHEVLADPESTPLTQEVLAALLEQGELVKINAEIYYHREAYAKAKSSLVKIADRDGTIAVSALRDELGISRKYAVPLLEHFDTERVTRRDGDVRTLLER
jgi:selenocysteine-specific elongation factor